MKAKIFTFVFCLFTIVLVGCANTQETKIREGKDGSITVSSAKDIHATGVDITTRKGTRIKVATYDSTVNVPAISAQGKREKDNITAGGKVVDTVAKGVIKGVAASSGIGAAGTVLTEAIATKGAK